MCGFNKLVFVAICGFCSVGLISSAWGQVDSVLPMEMQFDQGNFEMSSPEGFDDESNVEFDQSPSFSEPTIHEQLEFNDFFNDFLFLPVIQEVVPDPAREMKEFNNHQLRFQQHTQSTRTFEPPQLSLTSALSEKYDQYDWSWDAQLAYWNSKYPTNSDRVTKEFNNHQLQFQENTQSTLPPQQQKKLTPAQRDELTKYDWSWLAQMNFWNSKYPTDPDRVSKEFDNHQLQFQQNTQVH